MWMQICAFNGRRGSDKSKSRTLDVLGFNNCKNCVLMKQLLFDLELDIETNKLSKVYWHF
jgi:hypothetical protein